MTSTDHPSSENFGGSWFDLVTRRGGELSRREEHLTAFAEIVGSDHVLTKGDDLVEYGRDWTRLAEPAPLCIVLPSTTEQVSQIVRYCESKRVAIVPSGGRTGLAGGAVAASGEVVLSLCRMNRIDSIDEVNLSAVVDAGVTNQTLQNALSEKGLQFPVDLAAKGSCQIGGNVATNAGGLKFIRYGGMREQVLGLEVVLGDGKILDLKRSLRKNNTGYDLTQLFVGSEGTLGIITKVVVKLVPLPQRLCCSILAVSSFLDVTKILAFCRSRGLLLTAFEFLTKPALESVLQAFPSEPKPFQVDYPLFILIEFEEGEEAPKAEAFVENLFHEGLVQDAVFSQNSSEFAGIWRLRENITESLNVLGHVHKNDVSVPISSLDRFLVELQKLEAEAQGAVSIVLFGHVGDGNVHINYVADKSMEHSVFMEQASLLEEKALRIVEKLRGSISAEHGIGLLKKGHLKYSRSVEELSLMKEIKTVFDPSGILNPGKIF